MQNFRCSSLLFGFALPEAFCVMDATSKFLVPLYRLCFSLLLFSGFMFFLSSATCFLSKASLFFPFSFSQRSFFFFYFFRFESNGLEHSEIGSPQRPIFFPVVVWWLFCLASAETCFPPPRVSAGTISKLCFHAFDLLRFSWRAFPIPSVYPSR